MRKEWTLFITFLKIGAFTFGGGYAMIALLENEFVERKKWIKKDDFLNMVAIAESTPGPVAINSATYIGYKIAGLFGAAAATVAVCFPFDFVWFISFSLISYQVCMDYNFSFSLCQGVFQKNSRIRCEFCFLLIYDSVWTALCLGNPTRYSLIVKLTLYFYVYAPLRSVQNILWMFCTISRGSLSLKTTPVQAHRGFRLLTLASLNILREILQPLVFSIWATTLISHIS